MKAMLVKLFPALSQENVYIFLQGMFWTLVLLAVLYLLMTGWGWYLQDKASRSLYLCYSDWGTYVESYLNLASGTASWREWLSTGAHWNPLVNVIMALFVKIFRTPGPLYLFNSMLIYSAVPLVWILSHFLGIQGIQMTQMVSDLLTLAVAVFLQLRALKSMGEPQTLPI